MTYWVKRYSFKAKQVLTITFHSETALEGWPLEDRANQELKKFEDTLP